MLAHIIGNAQDACEEDGVVEIKLKRSGKKIGYLLLSLILDRE